MPSGRDGPFLLLQEARKIMTTKKKKPVARKRHSPTGYGGVTALAKREAAADSAFRKMTPVRWAASHRALQAAHKEIDRYCAYLAAQIKYEERHGDPYMAPELKGYHARNKAKTALHILSEIEHTLHALQPARE